MKISFTIPVDPFGKERHRLGKGRMYTPKQTKDYEQMIGLLAKQAMVGQEMIKRPDFAELNLFYVYPLPCVPKKPDVDNVIKIIMDGMNKIVYEDDCQVNDTHEVRVFGKNPHIQVVVQKMYNDCVKWPCLCRMGGVCPKDRV